jgi:hypothetical protein
MRFNFSKRAVEKPFRLFPYFAKHDAINHTRRSILRAECHFSHDLTVHPGERKSGTKHRY